MKQQSTSRFFSIKGSLNQVIQKPFYHENGIGQICFLIRRP
jgi:hypothetical protein